MNRRKFLKATSATALTVCASTGAAAAVTDDGVGTYSDCEDCWNNGGSYNDCCGPYGPCADCEMK